MQTKKPWQSKTIIVNIILALLAAFAPGAHDFIVAHPDYVAYAFAAVNVVLRLITKGAVQLVDDTPAV